MSPRGLRGETAPPFLGEREGQGAGFPEIWGVPPLLKPPSPATPPLSWNPVPRGGGEGETIQGAPGEGAGWEPGGLGPGWRWGVQREGFRVEVSRGRKGWVRAQFGWGREQDGVGGE